MQEGYLFAGRYKVLGTIGEGGMANVYLAEDTILHREVAVKSLRLDLRDDKSIQERFKREAISTSELSHPNIVNVLDVGVDNGNQFMVIEYVKGTNLKTYIRQNFPIPYQQVIDMMEQIMSAVKVAHEHNIVHRDLKPENILVDNFGRVKVSDFGIALALSERSITQTNATLGSVYYMSPEQTRGKKATTKSDIYSLGIILYEMLTKHVPFSGDTAVSVALKHFRTPMPSAREVDPRIPQALENVIFKATAKDPEQRYNTVVEMAEDLKTTLLSTRANEERVIVDAPQDLAETKVMDPIADNKNDEEVNTKKKSKKRRAIIISTVILLIALIAGIFWLNSNSSVAVPNVSNLTKSQAEEAISSKGLEIGDIKQVYSDTVKKGRVIDSDPEFGTKVKNNSSIDLKISLGQKKYKIGDYVGEDYSSIKEKLEEKGFTVTKKTVYSESYDKGTIITQSLPAGERVVPNKETIEFEVSKGINEATTPMTIENLVGKTIEEAKTYVASKGYSLSISYDYSDTVDKDKIISQTPAGGSKLLKGSVISIVVSKGEDPEKDQKTTLNYLVGSTLADAQAESEKYAFELNITYANSDTVAKDVVISQSPDIPNGGSIQINRGSVVTIVVSKGKQ
ncbi:protein kinase [Companilactobacillus sp. RD055328]|uniref:Stk1 family PASTA domain-containing Ser/Thr kinase n=1 Tax=Companilactobacillus sp. RD055328 TaxID=2916634 RepID=UPI001FC8B128|nr:Stk1 family PASTA domain-containing Ser/Thr kinase [Companilactobacillus sp. RD055328]GKQ42566.1 protein kinase [Companilactobacillus sp. RD055328]